MFGFLSCGVLLGVAVVAYGDIYKFSGCPKITVMDDVDFDKFSGEWYVLQRFKPMASCNKLLINKTAEGDYAVNETSGFRVETLGLVNLGFYNRILSPRKIYFPRNDTKSIYKVERGGVPNHFRLRTFGVLETDYDNYAVVWGCDPVLFGSIQNVDVLSRTQVLDRENDIFKKAREILQAQEIDPTYLSYVEQTRCDESHFGFQWPHSEGSNTSNIIAG